MWNELRCFSEGSGDRPFHYPGRSLRTNSPRCSTLLQQGDGFSSCLLSPDLSPARFSNPQELKNLVVHRQGLQADKGITIEFGIEAQARSKVTRFPNGSCFKRGNPANALPQKSSDLLCQGKLRPYELIHAEKVNFPIALMCQVLKLARSVYYAWCKRNRHS
jgi:hypothetical protein